MDISTKSLRLKSSFGLSRPPNGSYFPYPNLVNVKIGLSHSSRWRPVIQLKQALLREAFELSRGPISYSRIELTNKLSTKGFSILLILYISNYLGGAMRCRFLIGGSSPRFFDRRQSPYVCIVRPNPERERNGGKQAVSALVLHTKQGKNTKELQGHQS